MHMESWCFLSLFLEGHTKNVSKIRHKSFSLYQPQVNTHHVLTEMLEMGDR